MSRYSQTARDNAARKTEGEGTPYFAMTEEDCTRDDTQNFWDEMNEMPDWQNLLEVETQRLSRP